MKLFRLIIFLQTILILSQPFVSAQPVWHTDPYPLNENIDIIHYRFELRLEDDNEMIKGMAEVTFRIEAPEKKLYLDLSSADSLGGMTARKVLDGDDELNFLHENDRLIIQCPVFHGKDTAMTLNVYYSGIPKDGLIISETKFGDRSFFGDNWPDRARNWLPCVDHVSDKATVEFVVDAPGHYEIVSNGYLYRQYEKQGGRKVNHWKSDVPLPTKVMVIGAAEFSYELAGYAGDVPVQTWVYPQNMKEGFYDYAPAVGIVDFYTELLGDFAFEKLANVQSKTVYGGMENSGCIFYHENSVTGRGRVESLLAHEIAHQWFGDAVTEKDWHHVWLSEGFATYLTSVYMDSKPGNNYLKGGMERSRRRVIESFKRDPKPVIDTSVTDLRRLLNTNSYQKGAWILHMLRNEIGDEAFWSGMRLYYADYKNKNALSEDFMVCMEKSCDRDLKQFFNQWLYQPGHPVLRNEWAWDENTNSIRFHCKQLQEQFIFDFPLELAVVGKDNRIIADTVIRIAEADESLSWQVPVKPDNLLIDPGIKLLMEISKSQN